MIITNGPGYHRYLYSSGITLLGWKLKYDAGYTKGMLQGKQRGCCRVNRGDVASQTEGILFVTQYYTQRGCFRVHRGYGEGYTEGMLQVTQWGLCSVHRGYVAGYIKGMLQVTQRG